MFYPKLKKLTSVCEKKKEIGLLFVKIVTDFVMGCAQSTRQDLIKQQLNTISWKEDPHQGRVPVTQLFHLGNVYLGGCKP